MKRQLWALMYAKHAFSDAKRVAELHIKYKCDSLHELHYPFVTSMAITYARPFTKCGTIPKLPKHYSQFTDKQLKLVHDTIIKCRHEFYAHSDATALKPLRMFVSASATGLRANVQSQDKGLSALVTPPLINLCETQLERIENDCGVLVQRIFPQKTLLQVLKAEMSNSTVIEIFWPKSD